MNCENQDFCPIYGRHGNNLCAKLFRADKCPQEFKYLSKSGYRDLLPANEARLEAPGLPR